VAQEKLTGSDVRVLALWVLAGVLGLFVAHHYYFQAFPEASVNFQVSREEALTRAKSFVNSLGQNVDSYQSTIVFDVDENAKTYLERELGLQQANQMMSSQLNIWYWDARFFKPQQEEEFRVRISPAGKIVGYSHIVPKSQAGGSLDRAAAQRAAQDFLTAKLGVDLNGWDFLSEEANSEKMPARLDWTFNWEKHGFRAKDAPYRLKAILHGENVGGSGEYLQVPEAWERSYQQLRSRNTFLAQVTIVPYVLVLGAALWLGITLTRRGNAHWGGAIKLGIVVTLAFFCMQLNEWPISRAGYDTNTSYGSFVFEQIAIAFLFAIASAITVPLVMPAGEALYKVSQPGNLQLRKAFTLRGLRSKEFFSAAVVGICLTGVSLGYVVVFYLYGGKHGVWAPQELSYANEVSTLFPWISGVAIGLLAATNEEFTFRLFAIPFVQRLTGSRVLAVILPAFCWSFLHANYPQEPPYIRGIEIGIMGIVAGLVMLRWGIVATLIWHYTFDAAQVGLLLIRSNSLYFKISGIVVGAAALAPLLFACISYLSRGGFEADEDLLNRAEERPDISFTSAPAVQEAAISVRQYVPLTSGMIGFLALCIVAGAGIAWKLKPESIGDYLELSVNARSSRARADEIIRQRKLDPNSYYHATVLLSRTDPATNEFLRERIGIKAVNDIYATRVPGALWHVRYFRDSQAEEYGVVLKPDGSLHSVHHTLAEDAAGASLSKDDAVTRGEKYLREEKKLDLSKWALVEAKSDKRPHRIDHTLTWQENAPLDPDVAKPAGSTDHAYARVELQVLGDEVTSYRTYIQIPEEWRRTQSERTVFRTTLRYGALVLIGGLVLATLILFLKNLRSEDAHAIPWRRLSLWALWGLLAFFVVFALGNKIPDILDQYPTEAPFKLVLGGVAVSLILGGPVYYGGLALLFGLTWFYARRAFGEERIPAWSGMPAAYYRDALWIGIGGAAGLAALFQLVESIASHWFTPHRALAASFGTDFDAILPAASILGTGILQSLFGMGLIALIASFFSSELRWRWLQVLLFLFAAVVLAGGSWGNSADFAKQVLVEAIHLTVIVFGVRYVMRFNLLGGFLILILSSLLGGAVEMLSQPDAFYHANGYVLVLALTLFLAWPLLAWRAQLGREAASA
jgi:hypothetical protein